MIVRTILRAVRSILQVSASIENSRMRENRNASKYRDASAAAVQMWYFCWKQPAVTFWHVHCFSMICLPEIGSLPMNGR